MGSTDAMEPGVPAEDPLMTTETRPEVLDPATAKYVLPSPPRPGGDVVVVAPRVDSARAFRRGGQVAQALGERFLMLAEAQEIFASELRTRLHDLDVAIPEATKAQLKGAVRDLLSVLEWNDAVQADVIGQSRLAAMGAEPIDVVELCSDVAAEVQGVGQPVVVVGGDAAPWWGVASDLAELVRQALAVVGERSQGVGARSIEVGTADGVVTVQVRGYGDPADAIDVSTVARFRRAASQVGARVRPDALGPGGVGLVVDLPSAAVAAG